MARNTTKWTWGTNLYVTWVVLGISLLVNAILIASVIYLASWHGDQVIVRTGLNNACTRDYDRLMSAMDTAEQRIFFSEAYCHRDAKTGSEYTLKVENGHVVQK